MEIYIIGMPIKTVRKLKKLSGVIVCSPESTSRFFSRRFGSEIHSSPVRYP
jgi:hypothetical protein